MNAKACFVCVAFLALVCVPPLLATPNHEKGVSVHMLPKRVADLGGRKWGFSVDYSAHLKPESEQPVLQNPQDFLAFVRKQDKEVQENGVWIVVSHPDAYSDSERALLDQIKSLCRKEKIALFICRASELPNGWKRFD